MTMIVLQQDGMRFSYRVAGVCIHDDHVLLHRAEPDDFWALPGGRCELLEASTQTLLREMREEIQLDIQVGRLLWIIENFFTHHEEQVHELALYYEFNLPDHCALLNKGASHTGGDFTSSGLAVRLEYKWFRLDELPRVRLYPTFFKTHLQHLPEAPCHVIHQDEADE